MALLPGASAGATALHERTHDERDYEPRIDAEQEGRKQPESGLLEPVRVSQSHRVSTLALFTAIALAQVAWGLFLGYVAYSAWIRLPF